eukprot:15438808-Alexandrium_andersonii.AAC.1
MLCLEERQPPNARQPCFAARVLAGNQDSRRASGAGPGLNLGQLLASVRQPSLGKGGSTGHVDEQQMPFGALESLR